MRIRPKVSSKWIKYRKLKNVDDFVKASKTDSFLKRMLKSITIKKVAVTGIAVGTTTVLATEVEKYIYNNSGCFLYSGPVKKCKVAELSCCQPKQVQNIPLCKNFQLHMDKCNGYSSKTSTECCRFCDVKYHNFLGIGETLKCSSPTIVDALAHLSSIIIAYPGKFLIKIGFLLLALFVFILFIFVIKS